MDKTVYDVLICGAGPAGLSAALYAARAGLNVLVFEKAVAGGQITQTTEIENYPGALEGETGFSLTDRMRWQAERFGAQVMQQGITGAHLSEQPKRIVCADGEYYGKTVIIASGAYPTKIGCPGEARLTGAGVSYCATCDAPFFRNRRVFVVGGGDTALTEAIHLTKFAESVTIVHRRDKLRTTKTLQDRAKENPKIAIMWNTVVHSLDGDGVLSKITFENVATGEMSEVLSETRMGLFVCVGRTAETELFEGQLALDGGYIVTDEDMRTNIMGVYAAGDVRKKSFRQVVTAAADGAIAAAEAAKYVEGIFV